jgi:LysM repeat protein
VNTLSALRVLSVLAIIGLALMVVPSLTLAAPADQATTVYYVQWGDTLFSISRRFNTTVPAIMAANNLYTYYIYAGQRLMIPTGVQPPLTPIPGFNCKYTVQTKDTVFSIAWRYKIPYYQLMQANNLYSPYITVGMQLNVPCTTPAPAPFPQYQVQPGDNLFRIAVKYETSIYAIALVNGIWNVNLIYPGQVLVVPYPGTVKYGPVPTITPGGPVGGATSTPTRTPTATPTITPTPNAAAAVVMTNNTFVAATQQVKKGDMVLWKNTDTVSHTVTSGVPGTPDGKFRSGTLAPGQTFTFTFNDVGEFPYYSELDNNMTGKIVVVQP